MHGTRNDFVLVDAREREPDGPALARAICDRHGGIGADGLLAVHQVIAGVSRQAGPQRALAHTDAVGGMVTWVVVLLVVYLVLYFV